MAGRMVLAWSYWAFQMLELHAILTTLQFRRHINGSLDSVERRLKGTTIAAGFNDALLLDLFGH